MSRYATSFVLGYHGCSHIIARKAITEGWQILNSERDYDWLGPGAYFWEADPKRALEWAQWKVSRGDYEKAAVIGAVINLGNCLNLVNRGDIELLRAAYESYLEFQRINELPIPQNRNPLGSSDPDRLLRYLDCAVFKHLHDIIDQRAADDPAITPFDTVRGMFVEGERAYPGSGLYQKSHVQIAVRNWACVKGLFLPIGSD